MSEVWVTREVQAPARQVWATVAQGGEVHRWFGSVIRSCRLEGQGAGARRYCEMTNGAALEERILEVDHGLQLFRYAIDQHPLPSGPLQAEISVRDLGGGRSEIRWGARFDPIDGQAEAVSAALREIYTEGIASLERHCAATMGVSA